MSFFGLFKKEPKNPLEELKQNWNELKTAMEKFSQERLSEKSKKAKQQLSEFQKKIERIFEIIISEDKVSVYESTQVLSFFLDEKLFTYMTGYALNVNTSVKVRITLKVFLIFFFPVPQILSKVKHKFKPSIRDEIIKILAKSIRSVKFDNDSQFYRDRHPRGQGGL